MAVRGDAADLVFRAGAGIICDPENSADIARAIENLAGMNSDELNDMGKKGVQFYMKEMSLLKGTEKFEAIFKSVTGKK